MARGSAVAVRTGLDVHVLETPSLGDRSYLVSDGTVALVVDPQRDIDRIVELADRIGVRIAAVAETHGHNDYVSGGLELSRLTGARYLLPEQMGAEYPHTPVADGDVVELGTMRVTAVHTPGHTHHHTAYAVAAGDGPVQAVLTGGSMLFGSSGRTDLVGADDTDVLTRAQYHSVRRLAAELPGEAAVLPTHGFGSFCSATPTSGEASTIAEQRSTNPALTQDEATYVAELLAGLDAFPAYYAHMGPINRQGPAPIDLTPPRLADPAEVRRRIQDGEWVVDLRNRRAFAAGHLEGVRSIELGDQFATYVGWLVPWGTPLTILGETADDVATARRELARIGIDELAGAATGRPDELADGQDLRSYRVADFTALAARRAEAAGTGDVVHVLDARRHDEHRASHVAGSQHIPIHEIPERLAEVPTGEVWVYCGSGYRASIAASMLDLPGRTVVHVDEDFDGAAGSGLEMVAPDPAGPAER